MKKPVEFGVRLIKSENHITKAENSTAVNAEYDDGAGFITPRVDLYGLKALVNNSSILPQCIRAYKNNIAGFGIGVRYKTDAEETPEMKAEWDKITEVLELLNMDQDTKEVFEDVIEARETYGIAYIEVIRNLAGEVTGVEFIRDTPSVSKTTALLPYVDIDFEINGVTQTRKKKFCKYRQQLNGKTVYFKEMGDSRIMDLRTGEYDDKVPIEYQANELLEFAIGTEPYGEVRWIGTVLNVDGCRKAENLNNRYFAEGRHTPLMIMVNGGTLTDDSFDKLQTYMNDIKGENGQHGFIVLEAENMESRTDMEGDSKPNLEIVKLADILQKDELFQDYLNNGRRKVQSAFQLPDLYVGYTTDFNRATAQSAQEVTEKQVFQPERESLAWIINHKLLADYHFKYVEAYFLEPDISNPDDLFKLLTVCNNAGGLTPNKAKEIIYKAFGETSENFEGDWADMPLAYSGVGKGAENGLDRENSQQVKKSFEHDDVELMAVMKEIRQILIKNSENGEKPFTFSENYDIIKERIVEKYDPDQPRDENGRWTSGGASGASASNSESGEASPARGDFGGANVKDFCAAVQAAKDAQDPSKAWRVTAMPEDEFKEEHPGAICHITAGGSVAAVTADGDIVSVCGMPGDSVRGKDLLAQAVAAGGTKLDSYDGNHGFYVSQGFEPVSWCKWSDEYAPPGWNSTRDAREDIVFYKYTGNKQKLETGEDKKHLAAFKAKIAVSDDYNTAQSVRDSAIKKAANLFMSEGGYTMFTYNNIEDYISDIRKALIHSCWQYTEDQANALIAERMSWIKESFEKQEDAWETAMDVGYCCG